MSLDYTITSPAVISGPSSSELFFQLGGDSINFRAPTGLSSTYDFVLPPTIGTQGQILALNSGLETEWVDTIVQSFTATDTVDFISSNLSFIQITNMILTPPAGTYYCNFSSFSDGDLEFAIFVDGNQIVESTRRGTGNSETLFTITVVTVDGNDDIEVRSRTLGGSYTIFERTLVVNRLA